MESVATPVIVMTIRAVGAPVRSLSSPEDSWNASGLLPRKSSDHTDGEGDGIVCKGSVVN